MVIPLIEPYKYPFSAMELETMEVKGEEIPISISIKTKNNLKIFILDLCSHPLNCSTNLKNEAGKTHTNLVDLNDIQDLNKIQKDLWNKNFLIYNFKL